MQDEYEYEQLFVLLDIISSSTMDIVGTLS